MDLSTAIQFDTSYYDFSFGHALCEIHRSGLNPAGLTCDSSTTNSFGLFNSSGPEFPYYKNLLGLEEILDGLRPRSRASSCAGPMEPTVRVSPITSATSDPSPSREQPTITTPISVGALAGQLAFIRPGRPVQSRSGGDDTHVSSACASGSSGSIAAAAARATRSRTDTHDGAESTTAVTEHCVSDATRGSTGTGMSGSCLRDTAQSKDDSADRGEEVEDEASSSGAAAAAAGRPSRHLWLGNLLQRATQGDVEAVFSPFGPVESVRVFPSKPSSYGFVNYPTVEAAMAAKASLEGRPAPPLTGPKPLLIRYQQPTQHPHHHHHHHHAGASRQQRSTSRPSPLLHPSSLEGPPSGGRSRSHSTSSYRRPALSLADAAAIAAGGAHASGPASAGAEFLPAGEDVLFPPASGGSFILLPSADAAAVTAAPSAFEADPGLAALLSSLSGLGLELDGTAAATSADSFTTAGARGVVSAPVSAASAAPFGQTLQGAAAAAPGAGAGAGGPGALRSSSSSGRLEEGAAQQPALAAPPAQELATSRHLWLGNMLSTADVSAVEAAFSPYGPLESIRLFPDRNFAFVNFLSAECAAASRAALNGRPLASLTGSRPMEIRFQTRPPHHMHLMASRAGSSSSAASAMGRRGPHPTSPPMGDLSPPLTGMEAPDAMQPRLKSLLQLQLQQAPQGADAAATARALSAGAGGLGGSAGNSFSGPRLPVLYKEFGGGAGADEARSVGQRFDAGQGHIPMGHPLPGHMSPPQSTELDPAAGTPFLVYPHRLQHPHHHNHHHHQAGLEAQTRPQRSGGSHVGLSPLGMMLPPGAAPGAAGAADLAAMSHAARAHSQLLQALALEPRGSGPVATDPAAWAAGVLDASGAAAAADWAGALAAAAAAGWPLDGGFGPSQSAHAGPANPAAVAAAAAMGAAGQGGWPAAALAAARMSAPAGQGSGQAPGGLPSAGASGIWLGGSGSADQDPLMAFAQAAAWLQQDQQQQQQAAAARNRALTAAFLAHQHQQPQQRQQQAGGPFTQDGLAAAAAAAAGVEALLEPSGDAAGMLPGILSQHYCC